MQNNYIISGAVGNDGMLFLVNHMLRRLADSDLGESKDFYGFMSLSSQM